MRADPPTGLPEDLGGGGHLGTVRARAAAGPGGRPGPRRPAEQPDGGFAVEAGHGHDFVQQPVFLGSRGALVPLPLLDRVLSQARSGHRHLLDRFGNPDF